MILDLGCGGNLHEGATGIDIVGRPATAADIVCKLGFEKLPVEDSSVDKCISEHFIEHIPGVVWYQGQEVIFDPSIYDATLKGPAIVSDKWTWVRHLPLVYLFNDVYRVLNHNGVFSVRVPIFPHIQAFQDPTHFGTFWTTETVNYFSGDYYGFHDVYGHTSRFECIKKELGGAGGWWFDFELRAIKTLPADFPYLLKYEGVE